MKISAVIPTKNREIDLVKAVVSVYNQTKIPEELIIIDQSDNSESYNSVKSLTKPSKLKLIYIHEKKIKGLVEAKDYSLRFVKNEIVSFLEDDIILDKFYFKEIYKAFHSNKKILGCSGIITNADTSNYLYRKFHYITHLGIFKDKRPNIYSFLKDKSDLIVQTNVVSGGLSSWRSQIFDDIEFDTINNFHMIEDFEFSFRFNKVYPNSLFIISNAKLAHYFSPINRSDEIKIIEKKIFEFIIFFKKHYNNRLSLLSIFVLLISNLFIALLKSFFYLNFNFIISFFRGFYNGVNYNLTIK